MATDDTCYDRATKSEAIPTGQWYELEVMVSGNAVMLNVAGASELPNARILWYSTEA